MTGAPGPLLVLGATGTIGRYLRAIWGDDADVIWQSRTSAPGFFACDILNEPERLAEAASQCSDILCLSGVTDLYHRRTGASYADNSRVAQAAVLAAQAGGGQRVFLCSSAAVYGKRQGRLSEQDPPSILSRYGQAKREMEETARALAQATDTRICLLRIGNLAGADAVLGQWVEGFELDCFADGRAPQRSYVGMLTFASILHHLRGCASLPAVMNIAQPGLVGMDDLLDAAGLPWKKRPAPATALASVHLVTDRLQALLPEPLPKASAATLVAEWQDANRRAQGAR